MTNAPSRARRRHVREKATIDHLSRDVYDSKVPDEKPTERSLPVEDQVRARNGILARAAFRLFWQ